MNSPRNKRDTRPYQEKEAKEKLLLSDIYSEFSRALKKRAHFAIVAFLLALTYIFTRPIVLKGHLTFSEGVDTSTSQIVLNELFSSKELDQIIEKGRFQWRWQNQENGNLHFHPKIQLAALKDFLASYLPLKGPTQEITTLLSPIKVVKASNNSAKTLMGNIDVIDQGFLLTIDGQVFTGKWDTPITDPVKGLWQVQLTSTESITGSYPFILFNLKEAKEALLRELAVQVIETEQNPKLKLQHQLKGQVDTIALLSLMEKQIQSPAFQEKLARRMQSTRHMEQSAPKSHLFFDKHHGPSTHLPRDSSSSLTSSQGLLDLPQESPEDTNQPKKNSDSQPPALTFEERADRYFDSKVIEPHFLSTTEPIPAVQHWLYAPLFFLLFFLIFVFCESLLRIFRKGVTLNFASLSKRGFMVLSEISEHFSESNLEKIAHWLIEEKTTRYQLREVAARVFVQDTSVANLLNLKVKLEELGSSCQLFLLKNASTDQPRIDRAKLAGTADYSYLKVDFKKATKQLASPQLSALLSTKEVDFVLVQCPLNLDDPVSRALQKAVHFTIASNPAVRVKKLRDLNREKTLFITTS